jgi:TetR/AcrR family transcriptional regulator, cholesterol catabolism regulator
MPAAPPSRRTYAPESTRRAIIDSALALFEANGFHATSVQAVADDAEVTKGAFYHHFGSMEELVHIIHDELLDHMLSDLRDILGRDDGPADQLRGVVRATVRATIRFRSHVAVSHQERRYLSGTRSDAVNRKRDEMLDGMEGILRAGIEDGTFRGDIDARVATCGISGMVASTHQWLDATSDGDPERVADVLADIVLGGLART